MIRHILDKYQVLLTHINLVSGNQEDGMGDTVDAGAVPLQVLTDGSSHTPNELYFKGFSNIHGQNISSI